jgi:hypothetical protein
MLKRVIVVAAFLLLPAFGFAVTQRIVTVQKSGGTYTSLQAAILSEAKDLVGLDRQLTIQCYASAAPDTAEVRIDPSNGWTSDATHYIRIVVPPTERHAGKFDPTKYYRLILDYQDGIYAYVPYTRIEGVQFAIDQNNFNPGYPLELGYCRNCFVDGVLIDTYYGYYDPRHGIHATVSGGTIIRNSIIYSAWEAGIGLFWEPVTIENVTIVTNGFYGNALYGIDWAVNGSTGHVIRNVYCGGATVSCFHGPASSVTMTTSASSDNTGTSPNVSLAGAAFVNSSGAVPDMNLQASSALRGVGGNLSAEFTNDCAGRTRTAWDIGACAFVPSGPPPSPNELFARALYRDFLSRAPTTAELQQALSQLGGGVSRSTFVRNLCQTAEGYSKVTSFVQSLVLNILYQSFLNRSPTSGEVSSGDALLHSPLTEVLVSILASDEYFQKAQAG